MTCEGKSYCSEDTELVVVSISFNDNQPIEHKILIAPICVETEHFNLQQGGTRCFRFQAFTEGEVSFTHYACGKNASYQPDDSLDNNGAWLIVDDEIQVGEGYYYWSGTHNGFNYSRTLTVVDASESDGACDACVGDHCLIKIKTADGETEILQQVGESPCNVEVSCDGCPPHHIKCTSNKYPGYCCLSCEEVAKKIKNLSRKV